MGTAKRKRPLSPQTASFRSFAYEIVRAIPGGRVMTYGAIAGLIPPPRGMDARAYDRIKARWVGYAMADCPENVPWQRVVNAKGRVSRRPGYDLLYQRHLLEAEGVVFGVEGCVDLARFGWAPSRGWLSRRRLVAPGQRSESRIPRSTGGAHTSKARRKG